MTRALIFDFDGTLMDLEFDVESVRAQIAALRGSLGLEASARPILPAIAELEARDAGAGRRARELLDEAETTAAERAEALPTVLETIEALRAAGREWAVVSNNGRASVLRGLQRLRAFPALVVSRDDVSVPKPSPEGLMRAVQALGGRAAFVGDGLADAQAARAARDRGVDLPFIAVRGVHTDEAALQAAGTERIVNTLREALGG